MCVLEYLYWWAFFKVAPMFGCRCWCSFLLPAIAICSVMFFFCMVFEFMIDVHYGFIGQLMWQLEQLQQSLSSVLCSSVECLILYTTHRVIIEVKQAALEASFLAVGRLPAPVASSSPVTWQAHCPAVCGSGSTARWQNGHLGLFHWWQRCPLISDRFICFRSQCRFADVYRCWIPVSCWMSQSMVTNPVCPV